VRERKGIGGVEWGVGVGGSYGDGVLSRFIPGSSGFEGKRIAPEINRPIAINLRCYGREPCLLDEERGTAIKIIDIIEGIKIYHVLHIGMRF